MIGLRHFFFLLFLFSVSITCRAKTIQILHTNDLHGFFENCGHAKDCGGYAYVKAKIDFYKKQAAKEGIQTIVVDAGDFMEGNLFYMAHSGYRTLELMNQMGYDAIVIGNHDWMMGTQILNRILKDVTPRFAFLGANFHIKGGFSAIGQYIKPYKLVDLGDTKLAILGLTTNDRIYSWRFGDGKIKNYIKTAKRQIKKIKKMGVDHILALTHIGHVNDQKLVASTSGLDLVIGGHSHRALHQPILQKNLKGQKIPIFQAGYHGQFLGRVLIELKKGEQAKLVKSELLPIFQMGEDQDPVIETYIAQAREDLNKTYDLAWLDEVIGQTEVELKVDPSRPTIWSGLVTDAIRDSIDADISISAPGFGGSSIAAGNITRRQVFNSYPRVFDFEDRYGWHVWRVEVMGMFLKHFLKVVTSKEFAVDLSGIEFNIRQTRKKTTKKRAKYKVENIRIGGEELKSFKLYRIAVPEGVVRGGLGVSYMSRYVLRSIVKSKTPIWFAIMDKVSSSASLNSSYRVGNGLVSSVERSFLPGDIELEF